MNPGRLMPLIATITHVSGSDDERDEFGDQVPQTSTSTARCWIEQRNRDEDTANTDRQEERWRGYFEPSAILDGSARVTVGGASYELAGPPWAVVNPRTATHIHTEATLVRVA